MKSTGRKTVKVERTTAPLKKTARAAKQAAPVPTEKVEAVTVEAAKAVATPRSPTHAEIAKRSYEIYLARGGDQGWGSPEQDWLQAERELRASLQG